MAAVRIKLESTGGRRVLAAIRGVRDQLGKANKTARNESKKTRRQTEDDLKKRSKAEQKAAQEGARAVRDAERKKRAEWRLTVRERHRLFQEELSKQRQALQRQAIVERARQQAMRDMAPPEARRGRLRGIAAAGGRIVGAGATAVGGALIGGGTAALGVVRGAQGAFGIRSQMDILGSAVDVRQGFIRYAAAGGLTAEDTTAWIQRASQVGRRVGVAPQEILAGLMTGQELFAWIATATQGGDEGVDALFSNMEYFAKLARTTGTSLQDVIGAAGQFQNQFGLGAEGIQEAMNIIYEGALTGSLSLKDFASVFPGAIATFQAARGASGFEALREFQAIAQALRASGIEASEARTKQIGLLATLSNKKVARGLRRVGIDALDKEGNVRSLGEIVRQAADSEKAGVLANLLPIMGDRNAASALLMLRMQEMRARRGEGGARFIQERIDVDPDSGQALMNETLRMLSEDVSGEVIRQRVEREAALVEQSDQLIESFSKLTGVLTELEDKNPFFLQMGLPTITGAIGGAGIAAFAAKILGSGAAAKGGAAAAGAAGAKAAGAAGAAGALGATAAVGAGLGIAGAATAGISATGAFSDKVVEGGVVRERSLLDQIRELPRAIETAFAGGIWESISHAIQGPAIAEDPRVVLERRAEVREVTLDAESAKRIANAVQQRGEPGAGRRGEGSPR